MKQIQEVDINLFVLHQFLNALEMFSFPDETTKKLQELNDYVYNLVFKKGLSDNYVIEHEWYRIDTLKSE